MERLSGLDAGFLYMETPSLHMHTLKIALVDPSTVPGGYSFDRFLEELDKRLHLLPPFRRRLVQDPLKLHHPLWMEDPGFDLHYHVRRVGVPPPGTRADLDELIGEIAGHQLDRRHPLWQIWVVEGLESGEVAFVTKLHHAAADGIAASALLANVMSLEPQAGDPPRPSRPWRPEHRPGMWELTVRALAAYVRGIPAIPSLVGRTIGGIRAVATHRRASDVQTPRPILDVPNASFNSSLTPRRVFASTELSLEDFKTVRKAFGVSINDVVLGTVAGSLRTYLDSRGERLPRSLVAGVPTSTETAEQRGARMGGNKVSNLFTSLCTDIDDPVERLRAIHVITGEAKNIQNALGADMLADWVEYTPPGPYAWLMRQYSRFGGANRHRPPINLVVSNVPGPRADLYIAGAKLTGLFSVGPILEGIGLNITVWSYGDQMNVSAIACPDTLKDLHGIVDGIGAELQHLLDLARAIDSAPASTAS